MTKSRVRGFCNTYVARLIKNEVGGYTAEAPRRIYGAISGSITRNHTDSQIYSDDVKEEDINDFTDGEMSIEWNELLPDDKAYMLGHSYENGYYFESDTDTAPEMALGFCRKKKDGKMKLTWIYAGKFVDSESEEMKTKEKEVDPKTVSLKYKFGPRLYEQTIGGKKKRLTMIEVDEEALMSETGASAANALDSWFTEVPEPVVS